MKTEPSIPARRCRGFTLVELLVALSIGILISGILLAAVFILSHQVKAGTNQVEFNATARISQMKIVREVQHNKYFDIRNSGQTLALYSIDNAETLIRYVDPDNNPLTATGNRLDLQRPGQTNVTLCTWVTPINSTTPIFAAATGTVPAVVFRYHVGDSLAPGAAEGRYSTGPGFQGTEVRYAATPRNLQRWYD